MATTTKTFAYDAAAATALFASVADLPLSQRIAAREQIKRDAQRAWVRGGRIGANPMVCL